jgi:hypothetical protein
MILGSFCNKFPAAELNGNSIVARFVTKRGLLGAHCCGGEKILIEEQDARAWVRSRSSSNPEGA